MNTRVHRYEGTNFKSLQRINLRKATEELFMFKNEVDYRLAKWLIGCMDAF